MKILLCLDYSSFTKEVLATAKSFVESLKTAELSVLHVIDKQLFFATTGYETQLSEDLQRESEELKRLCVQYLGLNVKYIEEYGIPNLEIDETIEQTEYDLLIIGNHGRHGLGERLLGSTAEHLLRHSKKPVLIIP